MSGIRRPRGVKPPCNTPAKRRFRSKAEANKFSRSYRVPEFWVERGRDPKSKLYPYLCCSGEHWHLSHLRQDIGQDAAQSVR